VKRYIERLSPHGSLGNSGVQAGRVAPWSTGKLGAMTFDLGPLTPPPAAPKRSRVSELQAIARRIAERAARDHDDRQRQRVLVRQMRASGASWDDIVAEAQISRPTLARYLKGL
jgi:hypothetical protein